MAETDVLALLRQENARLSKTIEVLMERVERDVDRQGDAFTLFQTAITLEETVRERTRALKVLNDRLMSELQERERVEEALRVAKAQAEEANASKTKFLAAASHDLRQPLNAARLFVATLGDGALEPDQARLVDRAGTALDALDELLSVLLDISRLDAGGIKPTESDFRLGALLARIIPEYATLAQKRGLEVRVVDTAAILKTDARLLETILRNLLSNAIRYTETGRVLIGCRRRAASCRIEVWDTGIGIEADNLEAIFEEFRQVHKNRSLGGRGIGLGLSIVQRIARLLDLEISVRSTPGKGSMFSIEAPLGNPANVVDEQPQMSGTRLHNQLAGRLIAVVDNDPDILDAMAGLLKSWGADVVIATSADLALAEIIEMDRRPDLIVADYHLEGGANGVNAIQEINAEFEKPIPAIVLTSDQSAQLRQSLKEAGLPLLNKPVQPVRLRAAMLHAIGQPATA